MTSPKQPPEKEAQPHPLIKIGSAVLCAVVCVLVAGLGYQIYLFAASNGVNWDCPNQTARDAMTAYQPTAESASECFAACEQKADNEKKDILCRCPTSDGTFCQEAWVSVTVVSSKALTIRKWNP